MVIDSPGKCRILIEQVGSPNLKVLCDITNFYILGSDVAQAVHDLAPYIVHCHEKGVVGKYPTNEFLVPGEEGDEFPFDPFAQALGDIGYQQYLSVESFKWMRQYRLSAVPLGRVLQVDATGQSPDRLRHDFPATRCARTARLGGNHAHH